MAGTEKMAQVVQKFAPKTDDLDWIPGTNMVGQDEPAFQKLFFDQMRAVTCIYTKKKQINKQTDRQTTDRQTDRQTR